jgi:DNA-binding transcriptional MerR regulator
MGAAAEAIGVTPAFLRAAEAAGLFQPHRSGGGHRRYSRDELELADRARQLADDGLRVDAAVRIVVDSAQDRPRGATSFV